MLVIILSVTVRWISDLEEGFVVIRAFSVSYASSNVRKMFHAEVFYGPHYCAEIGLI